MYKKIVSLFVCICVVCALKAQYYESFEHKGEVGVGVGLSKYFGDLDGNSKFKRPKFSAEAFYLKQFNNYIGLKINGTYAFLAASDANSFNQFERVRNLSFNSDVWELSVSGQFNFFRFLPGFREFSFTPYVSAGVGVFSYDPYAYYGGEKYYLRAIGTEGQYDTSGKRPKPYGGTAFSFPFTFGMKYAITEKLNIFAEATFRYTTTDYLDDVSTTYYPSAFPSDPVTGEPSIGFLLQDRRYELGYTGAENNNQRGNSKQKDAFFTMHIGLSFNIQSYRCPTAR